MEEEEEITLKHEGRFKRDWTKGSIIGNLWSLSWPMIITQTAMTLGPTIDMVWVGKLGAATVAGVGISGMVVMLMNGATMGLQMGIRAMVARFVGAGDEKGANHVAQQAFIISIVFSIFIAAIGLFLAEHILLLLGLEADVVSEGAAYLRIRLAGMITVSLQMMTQSIMQASGDSLTPMKISIGSRLFHIALCPFLIFGWWIFPRFGVSGAAMTGVISQGIGVGFGLWILYSGRTRLRLTLRNFHFDGNIIWRILKIGIPAMINGTGRTSSMLVLTWLVIPFGTFAVAAHSLLQRIDMFVQMPAMALGQSAGVLAGQNLGAGHPERSARTAWLAVGLFTGFMSIISIFIWLWTGSIIRIFNTEPSLVEVASIFLRIQIIQYMTFGFGMVMMNCLNGVGDTMVTMANTIITLWGVQMPLAYFLPRVTNLGVLGIRWAMVIAVIVRGIMFAIYFQMGRWKLKQV